MADEITRVEFYMGTVPNKTGEGARILTAFAEAGINLIGFLGYHKTARNAEVVFFVAEKTQGVARTAKKAGLELGARQRGLFINGEDRIGAVAEVLGKLAGAGINVRSLHALCAGAGRYGVVVTVDAADLRKAGKVLGAA